MIAVFDIDGTLTDTMGVDVECYVTAVREVVGIHVPEDPEVYDEFTDAAVLETACRLRDRPRPTSAIQRRTALRLAELLEEALVSTPHRFRPIRGARDVFESLKQAGWRVALATGAWRPSAMVKLTGAEIPHQGVPLATSSEHRARTDIIGRAVAEVDGDGSSEVVYIGDGVWDGRAAAALGYGFIGIGAGDRQARLRDVGAAAVFEDLSDRRALLDALERAIGSR
jgi:phosphoglycolate phosphatase-like HAD superfamily hydrolase